MKGAVLVFSRGQHKPMKGKQEEWDMADQRLPKSVLPTQQLSTRHFKPQSLRPFQKELTYNGKNHSTLTRHSLVHSLVKTQADIEVNLN